MSEPVPVSRESLVINLYREIETIGLSNPLEVISLIEQYLMLPELFALEDAAREFLESQGSKHRWREYENLANAGKALARRRGNPLHIREER